ncbi:MAG TPA: dTMP kinase [Acidimicrobiia bacterium]|nr:dTMP kinase [Acidimicrobiia bacterium]
MTFIVFEGGEGSGKSTQAARLASWLTGQGRDVVSTFEPGDTKVGAQIRDLLLHGDAQLDARTELLLMLADRAQHVTEVIRPALARGAVVISDRYTPSTLAYQGEGRGLGVAAVEPMDAVATGGLVPDVVIVLDVPDNLAEARVVTVRDRLERAGDEFHARVRAAYRELAADRGWRVVDGSVAPGDVELHVREAVAHLFS